MTARGMISGCRNNSLTLRRSSVMPEIALNSPAESVVGTVICRTDGGRSSGVVPSGRGRQSSSASGVRMSFARQSCTAFAPSVTEPPPIVAMRSAFASRAIAAASITAWRGVCGGMRSKIPA